MSKSPNLDLPYIQPSQAQKHVTHNEAVEILDALVQLRITALDLSVPPSDPSDGLVVGVGAEAEGAFAGQDGKLACRFGGGWVFVPPREGFVAWVEARGALHVFQGGIWRELSADGSTGEVAGLGVNTSWDEVNRVSVAAPATLLSHEGAGHRVTVNKAGAAETASLLFQSGFSGRAEMGLAGNDDFSVKVSADGDSWTVAMSVEAASGKTAFGAVEATEIAGEAVQAAPDDVTPGRLMRADWGYGPGNLVGQVAQSMGLPKGAVLERGETAEGSYVRLADGTQICVLGSFQTRANAPAEWTFPKPFVPDANIWVGLTSDYGGGPRIFACETVTETQAHIRSWNVAGSENVSPGCRAIAVGRWF